MAETALVVFVGASRYTFAFYASRPLAVVASGAVLVALLSEMANLYVRLSTAVKALERERANKLMNLDVVVSSIAHEIKQPLMVITTCSTVIDNLLRKPKIDLDEVRLNLHDVTSSSARIAETIDVEPGPRDLMFRFREVRLDAALAVVHKHRIGSCEGRLVATADGIRYETTNKEDGFTAPLADMETFQVDYQARNLRIRIRKGRQFNFTDPDDNADRLFVFHRDVERARQRLAP